MNTQNPRITVIVPVYNVERYLRECLESISFQSFKNWECIIVDDGSTDNSGEICDEFATRDNRFRVIHQANGGLSAARNTGLTEATGEYLSFVDSDDYIEPDFLDSLLNLIVERDADIVQIGINAVYTDKTINMSRNTGTVDLENCGIVDELLKDRALPSYFCNKLFSKKVAVTKFQPGLAYEDIYTFTDWALSARKIVLCNVPKYNYRQRKSSIRRTCYAKNQLDYVDNCIYRASRIESECGEVYNCRRRKFMLKAVIRAATKIARNEKDKTAKAVAFDKLKNLIKKQDLSSLNDAGTKLKIRVKLFLTNTRLFAAYARFLKYLEPRTYTRSSSNEFA